MIQVNQSKSQAKSQLRFLIATDVHLGHAENHIQLGNDSYHGFQQVLNIAKREDIDFLLLGGDLFDQVNPTQKCIFKCLNLLRDNIFGDRQLSIGVKGMIPNFSNQNLNISLPIFTIHGNHDYPSNDFGKISVCDLLHASNYVNYFGKHLNLTDKGQKKIIVKPIIFQKSKLSTRLAIYGLGYIKDSKLNRMLQEGFVIFEEPQKKQETLCILIIHQNRYKGKKGGVGPSYQNCVHAAQFPKWMDLLIWCHQHEAIYRIQTESDIKIFQPGSTVITSYIQAEGFKKQCGLITVRPNKQFQIKSILLQKSYRPLITKTYFLQQIAQNYGLDRKINFQQYFDQQLSNILGEHEVASLPKKPIIRIKIDYTGQEMIRLIKLQQKYRDLVANSFKIFLYSQKRQIKKNFGLQDKQVLQMIKSSKVPKTQGRDSELTQQVMEAFMEQLSKSKVYFFDLPQLNQSVVQFACSENRSIAGDVKSMYVKQLQKKYGPNVKSVASFHHQADQQHKRLYQKLLQCANDSLVSKVQNAKVGEIKADISRLQTTYIDKVKQVETIFSEHHQKPGPSQTQQNSKSTTRASVQSKNDRRSSALSSNRESQSEEKPSARMSNSSADQDDCCRRAEREDYRQNDTRIKFERARQSVENKKKQPKGKKNVRFKKQQ